ncbi:hypothetical protein GCM10011380_23370 [Sphingomonas metalli]|uniref:PilZ domain-containing protein n=2 Tax=Sphingomonas metalli TaxID=1779358 RepID=A0A916T682_9SPHN|nr:hypothetical protein GCM10011380_23370 [Sphingomonas metalli]
MASFQPATYEERREPRLEVLFRARAIHPNGVERPVTIVNVSSGGFMARADGDWAPGDQLSVTLPVVGVARAEVRWSLGGRIGCQFVKAIDVPVFEEMLQRMRRSI